MLKQGVIQMKAVNGIKFIIPVNFVIRPTKQKVLITILQKYTRLQLSSLAELLNVSIMKINAVFQGKDYFEECEAKELVKLFCICCGN